MLLVGRERASEAKQADALSLRLCSIIDSDSCTLQAKPTNTLHSNTFADELDEQRL